MDMCRGHSKTPLIKDEETKKLWHPEANKCVIYANSEGSIANEFPFDKETDDLLIIDKHSLPPKDFMTTGPTSGVLSNAVYHSFKTPNKNLMEIQDMMRQKVKKKIPYNTYNKNYGHHYIMQDLDICEHLLNTDKQKILGMVLLLVV